MKNRFWSSVLIFVVTWLITYLISGIVPFNWDMSRWSEDGRIAYTVFCTGMGALFVGIYWFNSVTDNK